VYEINADFTRDITKWNLRKPAGCDRSSGRPLWKRRRAEWRIAKMNYSVRHANNYCRRDQQKKYKCDPAAAVVRRVLDTAGHFVESRFTLLPMLRVDTL
jgi:hypothetical protein